MKSVDAVGGSTGKVSVERCTGPFSDARDCPVHKPTLRVRLSEKGRAWVHAMKDAETELAAIWREPFETYGSQARIDWEGRQKKAMRVYQALQNQLSSDDEAHVVSPSNA